jgi:hypothetical protein
MLRRAWLIILPAILTLAFLMGTPVTGTAGPDPGAQSARFWSISAYGNFNSEPDPVVSLRTDQDDPSDDRVAQTASTVTWPDTAPELAIVGGATVVGPTHRPCAAPARAPPIA